MSQQKGVSGSQIRRAPLARPSFAGLRKAVRRPMELSVLIQDSEGWEIPLESLDISPAGMFVRSNFLFEVGDVHDLIFRSNDGDGFFRIHARVTRVEQGGDYGQSLREDFTPGMAYEFLAMSDPVREGLQELVQSI